VSLEEVVQAIGGWTAAAWSMGASRPSPTGWCRQTLSPPA